MPDNQNNLRMAYQELCTSYRSIDDFRTKLLAFLPLATGTGIFILIGDRSKNAADMPYLQPIGAFGFIITLGLFFFELYGIKKCTMLIYAGQQLEGVLEIDSGQFITRPGGFAGFINEPFASGVIYPAVLGAWTYLALVTSQPESARRWAILVVLVGFGLSFCYNLLLTYRDKKRRRERI